MRKPLLIPALLTAFAATPAAAQSAFPCDWQASAEAIVEPWEDNSATFANGAVRAALLDTAEPAAAAAYLLILHPPVDAVSGRTCTTVGLSDGMGYAAIFFDELMSGYDPAKGLTLKVPVIAYLPERGFHYSALLTITVNQSTGEVTVSQQLADG